MTTATSTVLAVRVIVATGKRFHGACIPRHVLAKATGSNTRVIDLPWRSRDDQDNFDIIAASDRDLLSVAREIAVSTGWDEEALILVHADPSRKAEAGLVQEISEPLARLSDYAGTFGIEMNFRVQSLDMEPDGSDEETSIQALGLAEKVASAIGGSCLGALDHPPNGDLADCLKRNRYLQALGSSVLGCVTRAGLLPLTADAAEALVQDYVETVQKNGFDVAFQSDDSIPVLAPRIALMVDMK